MSAPDQPFFLQALEALRRGDRRGAANLLGRELREGNTSQKNLPHVQQLAGHIGEIDMAIDAARRGSANGTLSSLLAYWAALASYGRSTEALVAIEQQSDVVKTDPRVLHLRGSLATQIGALDEAVALFRAALAKAPTLTATWVSLAMIKAFSPGDADLAAMEQLARSLSGPPEIRAPLFYAIGKAREDCGDTDLAFSAFAKGAELQRRDGEFSVPAFQAAADQAIRDFTEANLNRLARSMFEGSRSLFVTGLPRSGTTLTEQIVLGHSAVTEGAEVNLFEPALLPMLGRSVDWALAYEKRAQSSDPWGEIARDYQYFIDMRFRSAGLVVDKSLQQSLIIGLLLHAIPDARIAWLRRNPDDVAFSCFKTFFSTGLSWTRSLEDIADMMRVEDQLFDHWRSTFADRILVVPYEQLTADPAGWAERLQRHFHLPVEPGIERASRRDRHVTTASVGQVREPISTARIGRSEAFSRQMEPFRKRYYG